MREGPPWEGSVMVLGTPVVVPPRAADTPAMLRRVEPPGGWPPLVHDHHIGRPATR